jgi:hypothetical protein
VVTRHLPGEEVRHRGGRHPARCVESEPAGHAETELAVRADDRRALARSPKALSTAWS